VSPNSAAGPVLVPGIPLPDGLAKWHARPCDHAIIWPWRGDFPRSDANSSLTAEENGKFQCAAIIMIAEKGAAMIKGAAGQRLAA
jgi:hypothetical protein